MAVDKVLCLPTRYQDLSIITVNDETAWVADPDARNSAARVLLGAATNESQVLDWITDIDNSDPRTRLEWTMTSKGDSSYRFFYISIPLYSVTDTYVWEVKDSAGVVTQYGNIIYHIASATYYKAIAEEFDGVEPSVTSGWENYWAVYDITNLKDEILNDKLDIHIHDDIITGAYEDCIVAKADATAKAVLCDACSDEQWITMEKMEFMLDSVNSLNWQDKAVQGGITLKQAHKKFCC